MDGLGFFFQFLERFPYLRINQCRVQTEEVGILQSDLAVVVVQLRNHASGFGRGNLPDNPRNDFVFKYPIDASRSGLSLVHHVIKEAFVRGTDKDRLPRAGNPLLHTGVEPDFSLPMPVERLG